MTIPKEKNVVHFLNKITNLVRLGQKISNKLLFIMINFFLVDEALYRLKIIKKLCITNHQQFCVPSKSHDPLESFRKKLNKSFL
jgi:hypothetical protein